MSFDVCGTETTESLNELFSSLIRDLPSQWNGRQVTIEDALILNQVIQDKVVRFLFSQNPDSQSFEKIASQLDEIVKNPSAFAHRNIGHLFSTPDGLCYQPRDGLITQVGLRKLWRDHKTAIIVGAIAVAVITTVIVITVTTYGTGSNAAAALGSAAISGAQAYFEGKEEKNPNRMKSQDPPIAASPTPSTPTYNDPLFLEDGVMVNGQHYAYWEFFQKSKQEEFFTNFLNTPTTPPPEPNPYQPIPPQHGSSLLHSFFETLGRGILGPEIVGDVPPSPLQKSHLFTTPGERPSSCRIGGVNGINTPLTSAEGHAHYISDLTPGQSIDWVYNHSHGAIGDLAEVFTQNYLGISPNTSNLLTNSWVAFDEENKHNPNVKYLQFCHSQGAIHVRNALAHAPEAIRNRVVVVAIAPGAIVPKELCYRSFNYASKKDIVPFGELVLAGALDTNEFGTSPVLEMALEHRKELILLDPHPDAIGIDHDFRSPTFEKTLKDHIDDYLKNNGKYE